MANPTEEEFAKLKAAIELLKSAKVDRRSVLSILRRRPHDPVETLLPKSVVRDLIADNAIGSNELENPEAVRLVGAAGEPAFNTGWGNTAGGRLGVGFYKDGLGRVHLQGRTTRTSGTETVIFTLPAGYRPNGVIDFAVQASGAFAVCVIGTSGTVNASAFSLFSLDGISFRAT